MQQLRSHYERQETEELLDIARKDLTDEAREVLYDVLVQRGVSVESAQSARDTAIKSEAVQSERDKRLAPIPVRLVAFAIDVWIIGIALFVVLLPIRSYSEDLYANVVTVVWLVYFLLRDGIPGQSIGKRLLRIRTIQIESGLACNWSKSLWRNLSHFLFALDAILALGRRRMRLGDMIAGTIVVRASA